MPSNTHPSITAPTAGFPEEAIAAGTRPFYLGLLAHLPAGQPTVVLRLNEDEHDEILLYPGSTRMLGRNPNRPIRRWQSRCLGMADATLSLEFTEEPQPDLLIWHSITGPQGAPGPAGPMGPAGPIAGALVRVRATLGAAGQNVPGDGTTDLICSNVLPNIGGGYNGANGIFTCPVGQDGVYLIHATARTGSEAVRLELNVSTDGGNIWTALSASQGAAEGTSLIDHVTLGANDQLKMVLRNTVVGAATVVGENGNTAPTYLLITRIA